jgi:hypothetical protein
MNDDSLPDVSVSMDQRVLPATDAIMIAELKRRGYKVYPEKRVRIYASQQMIDRRAIYQLGSMHSLDHLRQSVDS